MADDFPELPIALRIPQDQRREAWKGRRLTRPATTTAPQRRTDDPGTARLLAELAAKAKAAAKAQKASRKEAAIIRNRRKVPKPEQETTMKKPVKKTARKTAKTTRKATATRKPAAKKARSARKGPASKPRAASSAPATAKAIRPGSKLETIAGLLTRPEGCTTADVMTACDWPSVSMPQQAEAAGLKLVKDPQKRDGRTVYRGEPLAA